MSTLAEITHTDLKSISCDASVKEAATRMRDEKISSLLVEKNHDLVGIITDTDVVRRAVAEGNDLTRTSVQTIMTSPIATIESMRTIQDAHDMMGDLGVRHLGVTDNGKLAGVVSARDLLGYFKRVSEPKISQD